MMKKFISEEDGRPCAVVEDEDINLRLVMFRDGGGRVESMGSSRESVVFRHLDTQRTMGQIAFNMLQETEKPKETK